MRHLLPIKISIHKAPDFYSNHALNIYECKTKLRDLITVYVMQAAYGQPNENEIVVGFLNRPVVTCTGRSFS